MSGSIFVMRRDPSTERRPRCFAAVAIAFMLTYSSGAAADSSIAICPTGERPAATAGAEAHRNGAGTAPIVDYTHVFTAHEGEAALDCPTAVLLSTIRDWLTASFGLPAADAAPRIAFISPEQLRAMRYGPLWSAPQEASQNGGLPRGGDRGVVAVYEDRTQTIYLARGWDQALPADVSVLVHEMVHHLQNRGGVKFACPPEREKLAYQAQARWLAQSGRSLESEFEVDGFTLLAITTCVM